VLSFVEIAATIKTHNNRDTMMKRDGEEGRER